LVGGQSAARKPLLQRLHRLRRATMGWRPLLIDRSPPWACRIFGPLGKRLDMLLVDHGIFRLIYLNKHRLGAQAWRSAQPAPHQIRAMARKGLRTIINLRGDHASGSYWLESAACRKHGVELINFRLRSRDAPPKEVLRAARDLLERVEHPVLMHCKSGGGPGRPDGCALPHRRRKEPVALARRQLAARYGHFRAADTGVLDFVFDRYLQDNARSPIGLFEWVDTVV
jgi:protein tyrosine phosphatase (PTP) superfamily phosphohydrolase (DUF442 family)